MLGTLFATTVNVLWNRQLQLRTLINTEVGELRLLRRAIFGCFGTPQHCKRRAQAITLLKDYTNQLRTETQSGCIEKLTEIQRNVGISVNEIDGTSHTKMIQYMYTRNGQNRYSFLICLCAL